VTEPRRTEDLTTLSELNLRSLEDRPVGVSPGEGLLARARRAQVGLGSRMAAQSQSPLASDPSPAGDSVAESEMGVANPFGSSTRAFEPNTEIFDFYADAYGRVQGEKAAAEQAAAAAAMPSGNLSGGSAAGGGGGGIYNAEGKTQAFINAALGMIGKMYVWGGTTSAGVDCSGLIYYALRAAGVPDARRYRAVDYRSLGSEVSAEQAQPGDVIYIDNPNSDTDHVGIYLGDGMMIESPTSGQRTKISAVGNRATSYRRILTDNAIGMSATPGGGSAWLYNGAPWNPMQRYSFYSGNTGTTRRI
jgi:cell wall-associated NlpC family hydrolase